MTEPIFKRTNHGRGHSYTIHGRRAAGVTTVLGILDKPALVDWAARVTASYAVDNWASLSSAAPLDRYEELKKARWEVNRKATTAGTRIHALGDRLARGEQIEDVPAEIFAQAEAYARFLDEWEIEILASEVPVCHPGYQYAGTTDLVCRVGKLDGIALTMDIKTGNRVYAETALQLTAYRHAELMLRSTPQPPGPKGGKRPPLVTQHPMIPTQGCAVAHVIAPTAEAPARVEFLPVDSGPDVWASWLHLLEVYMTWHRRANDSRSDDYAPPIGEPLYPEQASDHPFYDEEPTDE